MYKVYIFTLVSQYTDDFGELVTGLAITFKGKWVAGSCSQTVDGALSYLERMKAKIAERVGQPVDNVELIREWPPDLIRKAFETMP